MTSTDADGHYDDMAEKFVKHWVYEKLPQLASEMKSASDLTPYADYHRTLLEEIRWDANNEVDGFHKVHQAFDEKTIELLMRALVKRARHISSDENVSFARNFATDIEFAETVEAILDAARKDDGDHLVTEDGDYLVTEGDIGDRRITERGDVRVTENVSAPTPQEGARPSSVEFDSAKWTGAARPTRQQSGEALEKLLDHIDLEVTARSHDQPAEHGRNMPLTVQFDDDELELLRSCVKTGLSINRMEHLSEPAFKLLVAVRETLRWFRKQLSKPKKELLGDAALIYFLMDVALEKLDVLITTLLRLT